MGKILTVKPNYKPNAKQVLLHNAPSSVGALSINLYGGTRGGGKSAGILADAFMFCTTYPGTKACILRESIDAVKQSFLDKLPSLFPQYQNGYKIYEYRDKSGSFYPSRCILFPNGSYITFQRVATYNEAVAKQGWEFHYLGIDEVTKQDKRTVDYLLSLVRSASVVNKYTQQEYTIPTKVVFGCNPGGKGHKWVKDRFIVPTTIKYDPKTNAPIETRDVQEVFELPDKRKIKLNIRFIPATWNDNPFVDPSYIAQLMQLPEHKRKMDMDGNWNVVAGKMFEVKEKQILDIPLSRKIVQDAHEKGHVNYFISIDWGYRPSSHSALWHAVLPDNQVITFKEMYGQELVFEKFVEEVKKRSEGLYIDATALPHDMFREGDLFRNDKGKIVGETKADVFAEAGLNPEPVVSGKGKVSMRYDKIHSATVLTQPGGDYKFRISKSCTKLLEELDLAVYSDTSPEDMAPGTADHAIDAYGHFLVFYSDDIEPIGLEAVFQDTRPRLQKKLDEEQEYLSAVEEDEYVQTLDDDWDL